jgi:hypothetical protein
MLAQADFQRALALALGEFAEAWTIVGECAPVDRFDASHWGSGPQSFQVTLRHRVTGHLKVLGCLVTLAMVRRGQVPFFFQALK